MNFKNRIERCLKDIQNAYSESWSCSLCKAQEADKIIRGRARCISGRVEDLIAEVLFEYAKETVDDVVVFVDIPLSYETCEKNEDGKVKSDICYPDIVVSRLVNGKYEILYMVELKVNLGWGRHKLAGYQMVRGGGGERKKEAVKPIEQELSDELNNLRNVGVWAKYPVGLKRKTGGGKDRITFELSSDAKYDLVICSSKNVPKAALKSARDRIARNNFALVQMYILSDAELSLKHASKKELNSTNALCSSDVEEWGKRITLIVDNQIRR